MMIEACRPHSPVAPYLALGQISDRMLKAAQEGDAAGLAALREQSVAIAEELRRSNAQAGLDKQQRLDRLKILKKIVENDAQIRRLTDPWTGRVEQMLGQPGASEQLPEKELAQLESFLISNPLDIQAQLRLLVSARTALTIYGDEDPSEYMRTHLAGLNVREGRISFERAPGDESSVLLKGQGCATAVGFVANIKIQFPLSDLALVSHDQVDYLTAAIPGSFYRLQRRNSYRVQPLSTDPSRVLVPVKNSADGYEEVEVLDISVGGMSILVPAQHVGMVEQSLLKGCFLHLPGHTAFRCDLAVRHVHQPDETSGACRVGVDFVELNGTNERTVQQYVNAVDTSRRRLKPACS